MQSLTYCVSVFLKRYKVERIRDGEKKTQVIAIAELVIATISKLKAHLRFLELP